MFLNLTVVDILCIQSKDVTKLLNEEKDLQKENMFFAEVYDSRVRKGFKLKLYNSKGKLVETM